MPSPHKTAILALFSESESHLNRELPAPTDYDSLKATVINQELEDEIAALRLLLEGDDFDAQFKARCQARATQNADSCLSFSALPDGLCNTLYWKIAETIFQPKTMGQMLTILSPQFTRVITVDTVLNDPKSRAATSNISIKLTARDTSSLSDPATQDIFKHLIISGNTLLDARDITNYDFILHQNFFTTLSHAYPEVAHCLYQHNAALQTLHDKLLKVSGQGRTPFVVISLLIEQLRAGGTAVTRQDWATIKASQAVTDFFCYIKAQPEETREAILQLQSQGSGSRIADVIKRLENGNCVEAAANDLASILSNPLNEVTLNQHPSISQTELTEFKKAYGDKNPLLTACIDSTTMLTDTQLQSVFPKVVISTLVAISMLRILPRHLYPSLIQHATITSLPSRLLFETVRMDEEVIEAYSAALLLAHEKLGAYLISKSIYADRFDSDFFHIKQLIESVEETKRYAFLTKPIEQTELRFLLEQGQFRHVLEPELVRILLEQEELPFLHWIKLYHEQEGVEAILRLLTEPERIEILKITNSEGFTVHQWQPRHSEPVERSNFSFCCRLLATLAKVVAAQITYYGLFILTAVAITLLINPAAVGIAASVGFMIGSAALIGGGLAAGCGLFSRRPPVPTTPEPEQRPGMAITA